MLKVEGSISTSLGIAPQDNMVSIVAGKVNDVVITSSPGPISRANKEISNAEVPLETAIACLTPINSLNSRR